MCRSITYLTCIVSSCSSSDALKNEALIAHDYSSRRRVFQLIFLQHDEKKCFEIYLSEHLHFIIFQNQREHVL